MQGSQQHSSSMAAGGGGGADESSTLKALSADFLDLLDKGQAFSDVTFNVEDRLVYAHRCVLAARSPFFRMIFCGNPQQLQNNNMNNTSTTSTSSGGGGGDQQQTQQQCMSSRSTSAVTPREIPVGIVGYDVFMLLLQFLYSGHFSFSPQHSGRLCKDKSCYHICCSSAVEFGLDMLNAAVFFGVKQLSALIQKHLGAMAENASIDDVMRMLVTAREQENLHLWNLCSKLVAKSGLSSETLRKHLPEVIVWEVEAIRQKPGFGFEAAMSGNGISDEQKTKRMQKALDSSDVELVKLMVMGEGLNLDKAFALHYAVSSCSRKVVKTLLDLGAANVNLRGPDGQTPLHMAAKLGDPEKIAMLLDHEADPHMPSATGATAMDILQSGAVDILSNSATTTTLTTHTTPGVGVPTTTSSYNSKGSDHNRLRNCLELLERAITSLPPSSSSLSHHHHHHHHHYQPSSSYHHHQNTTSSAYQHQHYNMKPSAKLNNSTGAASPIGSILTAEHGSSSLLPEESDNNNFRGSSIINRGGIGDAVVGSNQNVINLPNDIYSSLSHGLSAKVLPGVGESPTVPINTTTTTSTIQTATTSDSNRLLLPLSSSTTSTTLLATFDFEPATTEQQQMQHQASRNAAFSVQGGVGSAGGGLVVDDMHMTRPLKMQRIFQDLKDLPVLREMVLKDFSSEAMKSVYNPTGAIDEEVSSGWQLFLQEHNEAR